MVNFEKMGGRLKFEMGGGRKGAGGGRKGGGRRERRDPFPPPLVNIIAIYS